MVIYKTAMMLKDLYAIPMNTNMISSAFFIHNIILFLSCSHTLIISSSTFVKFPETRPTFSTSSQDLSQIQVVPKPPFLSPTSVIIHLVPSHSFHSTPRCLGHSLPF